MRDLFACATSFLHVSHIVNYGLYIQLQTPHQIVVEKKKLGGIYVLIFSIYKIINSVALLLIKVDSEFKF